MGLLRQGVQRVEAEVVLGDCLIVAAIPGPFHWAPQRMRLSAQQQVAHLMRRSVSQNHYPDNIGGGCLIFH